MKTSSFECFQIEHGANIDARDISNATPLLFSAAEGLTEIIQMILEKGWYLFYGAACNIQQSYDVNANSFPNNFLCKYTDIGFLHYRLGSIFLTC